MPQGIEIKTLDDLPGFSQQQAVPGMQISPVTASPQGPVPVDASQLTPTYDVNEVINGAVSSLANIRERQSEAAKAATDALAKNTLVQQRVYDENVQQQEIVLDSYNKLQRIADNPIADLFALFDPKTWSKRHQLLEIEKAQLRANSSTMRGQAQMTINNQLPALREAEVAAAQAGFQNTKDMFGIIESTTRLSQAEWDLRLKATTLRMNLSEEQRKIRDDALKGMTVQQAKQELRRANNGQGDWAGMAGLLEEKIAGDEKRTLDIAAIKQNMANQQFDLAEKRTDSLIASIDFATGNALIEQALATGQGVVDVGGIKVPLGKMITGMEQVRKDTEALTQASLANSLFGMNESLQKLVTTNSAMALTNPQAATLLKQIADFTPKGDALKDPAIVQRFNAFLRHAETQTAEFVKQASANYKSPEAKAAFEEFAKTGVFSPQGAPAVAAEALKQPGIAVKGKFAPVWELYRNEAAKQIQNLNPANMPSVNLNSNTGSSQLLAWAFRNPNKKVDDIFTEVVQGGALNDQADVLVKGIFRKDALKSVLDGLSTAPGPGSAVYLNLVRDPRRMLDADGNVDPAKLATYLAQQTVLNGGKADYLQTFVDGLRTYTTQADSVTADPAMTTEDLSLLSTLYGSSAGSTVLNEFVSVMAQNARILNDNMQEAIRQDITGETQRRALSNISQELDPASVGSILQNVPSATGIGTADEIKAIYGTDPRFGSMIPQTGGRR